MFPEKIHRYIFLFGLFALGFGMMVGTVPTSIPQFILAGNWLLEGEFKRKWQQLKVNPFFWLLSSVFLMHVLGLAWSQDLQAGLNDVRIKMPLLLLPLFFFSAKPLSLKEFHVLLLCFIAGSVVNTAWCIIYSFVLHPLDEMRNASRFMSHIRLGLYLNVAIAACVYFVIRSERALYKLLFVVLAFYFVFVLYLLGLASGLMNFAILFLLALWVLIYRQSTIIKIAGLIVIVSFLVLVGNYVHNIMESQLAVKAVKNNARMERSPSGRYYTHFEIGGQKENGHYIQINIQPEELQREWKKQFPSDSFHYEARLNLQRYEVLIRYMASKGLNKDSAGFAQLNATDKENIQKNIVNYEFPSWSHLHKRTYELVNEYDEFVNNRYINGHSLTMRLYFWKAALHLAGQHPFFGVGTGDVQTELNKTYESTKSPLDPEWYKRPHNQFLTVTVALGIAGLLVFLFALFYPAFALKNYLPELYWPFFIIAVISFFLEDTLETQAGCTFYVFFTTFFVWMGYHRKISSDTTSLSL